MKKELELYIHIPFCVKKCKYCDFLSAASNSGLRESYVKSLCKKIRDYQELAKAYRVVSIFLGGGTPSVLESRQTREIFAAIYDTFAVDEKAEITTELNPGTVTKEKMKAYKEIGINRLSIGLQSVNNEELRMLGRIHTYEEFEETYELARKAGFENINIDLISAIPGQTVRSWAETLRTVAELKPEHISAYSLIIEEGTPFYEIYGEDREGLPDEDAERQMYQDTKDILEEYGYHRYEISNYAKDGYACQHNLGYWNRREYLGIGLGAASLLDNQRWTEVSELEEYIASDENQKDNLERLDDTAQMEEFMFLGLRKMEGVSKETFKLIFGQELETVYGDVAKKMLDQELLEIEGDYIRLTEKGIDISNYVLSEFIM